MKPQTLPVKRNPVSKGVFKRLSAVTRSRKQRVAATATADDFEAEDHSSKISRALTIIFLIHIVVIGLIFFHQRYLDKGAPEVETAAASKPAPAAPPVNEHRLPKISTGDSIYLVVAGDNYPRIAAAQEVDESDLRVANDNRPIVAGMVMKIPPRRIVAMEPPEVAAIRDKATATPAQKDDGLVAAVPVNTANAPKAQVVRPAVDRPVNSAAVAPVTPAASGKTYVVQPGDNVWRIANRFKVDQQALMKVNGINDPKKLKLGMTLTIPR